MQRLARLGFHVLHGAQGAVKPAQLAAHVEHDVEAALQLLAGQVLV